MEQVSRDVQDAIDEVRNRFFDDNNQYLDRLRKESHDVIFNSAFEDGGVLDGFSPVVDRFRNDIKRKAYESGFAGSSGFSPLRYHVLLSDFNKRKGEFVVTKDNMPEYMKDRNYDDVAGNKYTVDEYVAAVRDKGLYSSVSDDCLRKFFGHCGNIHIIQLDIISDDYHDVKDALIELNRWCATDEYKLSQDTSIDVWDRLKDWNDFVDTASDKAMKQREENHADMSVHSDEELNALRDEIADILPKYLEMNKQVFQNIIDSHHSTIIGDLRDFRDRIEEHETSRYRAADDLVANIGDVSVSEYLTLS